MELGAKTDGDEASVNALECGEDTRACVTSHGRDKYAIAVVVVYNEEVIVNGIGGDNEFSCLVGVDLTCGRFEHGGVTLMWASVSGIAEWKRIGR